MNPIGCKHDQMIADLRVEYRPQREWSQGRGLFLVFGHFLVGVAAGAWLMGLIYESAVCLMSGYGLAAMGGLSHLLFLGRPERAWRMMCRGRSSWISRGFWGLTLFLAGGTLYLGALLPGQPLWGPASLPAWVGYGLAVVGMVVLIVYMGFVYMSSRAIPFWNSPLHPLLYMAYAARGGIAVLMLATAAGAGPGPAAGPLTPVMLWVAVTGVVVVLWLLDLAGVATSGEGAARQSVRELFAGRAALYFYGGTLMVGFIVPALLASSAVDGSSMAVLAAIAIASVVGDFFIKFTTIRAGVYLPLRAGIR